MSAPTSPEGWPPGFFPVDLVSAKPAWRWLREDGESDPWWPTEELAREDAHKVYKTTREYRLEQRVAELERVEPSLPPTALRMVERVMALGAEKHGGNDAYLTDGRPATDHYDAAKIHMAHYIVGHLQDPGSKEHPLAHSIHHLMMALELELRGEGSES